MSPAGDLMEMEELATLTECLEAGEEQEEAACCNIANKKGKTLRQPCLRKPYENSLCFN